MRIKQDENRGKILNAAETLLGQIGRDAITIRAVATLAEVQAPTIYRIFADKSALLDAVAENGFIKYMEIENDYDAALGPVEELRKGWDIHVDFGLANPAIYRLMFGEAHLDNNMQAAKLAYEGLFSLISKLASEGYLALPEKEATFVALSSASGTVLTLLSLPHLTENKKYRLGIRETMINAITTQGNIHPKEVTLANSAITISSNLAKIDVLTKNEKALMKDWLAKILS